MPELPEVETIVRALQVNRGASIKNIDIRRKDILRLQEYEVEELHGRTIKNICRRGKFLVFEPGRDLNLIFHLGMSGRFYMLTAAREPVEKHIHVIVHLDNDTNLIYQDTRRFGGVWLVRDREHFFRHMGREPLSTSFTAAYLGDILKQRKAPVKNLLLNQHLISGIGNIYADEALFAAGIRPNRPGGSLSQQEIKKLHRSIRKVLRQGIELRGTTFRDYRDAFNESGGFQNYLKVYGRYNQPCPQCGNLIQRIRLAGRSTHFCANCQH
ncbi:MAG TPA: bifunctional DNA-formamidopyrimidine glycosylase/DNA-(apurinic or apyrimidinic site) lyase [Gelria sp.]|jgi:formamidopyrimidine-DNA glycosylase|nr:bifunctional DNA-formamidopyrimidine glycosylase/DNA-(apurinic or apyrimidinic site) lyase [Gelria sp.]